MKSESRRSGILFVVSAPSGAGKSTLLNAVRAEADFVFSVSCTTRQPRLGEIDGVDYHFLERDDFERRSVAGDFLESAEVHGHRYGTLREPVLAQLGRGEDMLIDIDIQGAETMRNDPDGVIRGAIADIFLLPPSLEELRRRLVGRGTETEAEIELRLSNAANELEAWRGYRYTLVSGSREEDLAKFRAIMKAERSLTRRMISE